MKTKDIIILNCNDLRKDAELKKFEDINLYDFKSQALSREDICKASAIIFYNSEDAKYLKNRYGPEQS